MDGVNILAESFVDELSKMAQDAEKGTEGLTWKSRKLIQDAKKAGMTPLEYVKYKRQLARQRSAKRGKEQALRARPLSLKDRVSNLEKEKARKRQERVMKDFNRAKDVATKVAPVARQGASALGEAAKAHAGILGNIAKGAVKGRLKEDRQKAIKRVKDEAARIRARRNATTPKVKPEDVSLKPMVKSYTGKAKSGAKDLLNKARYAITGKTSE